MARHNLAFLYGAVVKKPRILKNGSGEPQMALAFLNIVRGIRDVGDRNKLLRVDRPTIMTLEPEMIERMETWDVGDIIEIKGTLAVKRVKKSSTCDKCQHQNTFPGVLVYVNPFFMRRRYHCDDDEAALKYLTDNREVSNQIFVIGTLVRDPKRIIPKNGLIVTQYQIAINRKFRIRTDNPTVKTDYPWVKSYGKNAQEDWERLSVGSEVYIDGCLQARGVMRHAVCEQCGESYDWKDQAMEIVPYATEYLNGYRNDAEVEHLREERAEQIRNSILMNVNNPSAAGTIDDISPDDIEAGIDMNPK